MKIDAIKTAQTGNHGHESCNCKCSVSTLIAGIYAAFHMLLTSKEVMVWCPI
jgi:hypothetical protein